MVACRGGVEKARVRQEVKAFGTTTGVLQWLFDWLQRVGVERVVMESTGVYWKPVWRVLEEGFVLLGAPWNGEWRSRSRIGVASRSCPGQGAKSGDGTGNPGPQGRLSGAVSADAVPA